jgi:hypothetical protein
MCNQKLRAGLVQCQRRFLSLGPQLIYTLFLLFQYKRNLGFIGGGAAGGALIGGLAGGGTGALIGSALGAGAGTAGAAATGKKEITLPAETRLSFRLRQPLAVTVRG